METVIAIQLNGKNEKVNAVIDLNLVVAVIELPRNQEQCLIQLSGADNLINCFEPFKLVANKKNNQMNMRGDK